MTETNPLDPHRKLVDALVELANCEMDPLADVLQVFSNADLTKIWNVKEDLDSLIQAEWMRRDDPTECEICATPMDRDDFGRPRRYCSNACRQQAYRDRARKADEQWRAGRAGGGW